MDTAPETVVAPDDPHEPVAPPERGWLVSRRWFWIHAVVLGAILLALLPVIDNGSFAVNDEALYAAQAANLSDGAWASPRPAPDIDTDGQISAFAGGTTSNGQLIPYARHPLYPILLTPFFALGGVTAMMLLSVIGLWVAAVAGALVTRRLEPRCALLALWFIGLGTPLFFDGYLVMGHSLGAALAALVALCVIAVAYPPASNEQLDTTRRWLLMAAVVVSGGVLVMVRSEGAIVMGSLALMVGVHSLRIQRPRSVRLDWRRAGMAMVLAATAGLALLLDDRWADAITGQSGSGSLLAERRTDPLRVAWVSLLRPWINDTQSSASMMLVLVCAVLAPLLVRVMPRRRLLPIALLCVAGGAALFHLTEAPRLISGLAATCPVLVVGLLLVGRKDAADPITQLLAGASVVTTALILATTYEVGGAAEWGGRFFAVIVPLVVPVAVVALYRARLRLTGSEQRIAAIALAAITLSLSVTAVRANMHDRSAVRRLVGGTLEFVADHRQTRSPIIIVSPTNGAGTGRFYWKAIRDGAQVLWTPGLGYLIPTLVRVRQSERPEVFVVINADPDYVSMLLKMSHRSKWWKVADAEHLADSPFFYLRLTPTG